MHLLWDRNNQEFLWQFPFARPLLLIVQLASLVGGVKFPNLLIWVNNVSQGSLIVSIGHTGQEYICNIAKAICSGRDNHYALTLSTCFHPAKTTMAEYITKRLF